MMGHESCFQLLLCIGLVPLLGCYAVETTTEMPRDFLFAKPWDFRLSLAKNKTRFTDEEKKLIVQIHNSYRSLVLPPAAYMRELEWDDDLEQYAYNHTQLCTGKHSAGNMVKVYNPAYIRKLTAMGENLYYRHMGYYSIEEALWMFWREGKDYDISTGTCAPGKECGHYRIMAMYDSSAVGCAINVCNKFTISTYPTPATFFSCSYDGKYLIYFKPYTVGERGSLCHRDWEFEDYRNGLCIHAALAYYKRGFDGNTSVVGLPSPYLTTTEASTLRSARSVNQSCRRCEALPASVFLLICLAPLMFDYKL